MRSCNRKIPFLRTADRPGIRQLRTPVPVRRTLSDSVSPSSRRSGAGESSLRSFRWSHRCDIPEVKRVLRFCFRTNRARFTKSIQSHRTNEKSPRLLPRLRSYATAKQQTLLLCNAASAKVRQGGAKIFCRSGRAGDDAVNRKRFVRKQKPEGLLTLLSPARGTGKKIGASTLTNRSGGLLLTLSDSVLRTGTRARDPHFDGSTTTRSGTTGYRGGRHFPRDNRT